MKLVVADASSLILLAKAGVMDEVCGSFEVHIEESVFEECCSTDSLERYPDSAAIKRLCDRGRIRRASAAAAPELPFRLGRGESAAIALAVKLKADALLTDDGKAIKACRFLSIPYTTSPQVLIDLVRFRKISVDRARSAMNCLRLAGRYKEIIITQYLLMLGKEAEK
ncbi:MAG: hypothetical protein A3G34_01455 [Candidatus Lindowbacteria bacterium RIFCSPLOWO2_12_FULL_62_27]|nr:MAG: hypothetical protein A3G34_01455 [Candidatus Lindowbacteria bacterium RIFCSPLOWO2_12_FULL_62_27]OGH61918.1 MAG: hypothetical protein A3I06_03470 [Candidatus Lindowbacteria bacterium RIFCSPLOWO2_02_FULL_62_12]